MKRVAILLAAACLFPSCKSTSKGERDRAEARKQYEEAKEKASRERARQKEEVAKELKRLKEAKEKEEAGKTRAHPAAVIRVTKVKDLDAKKLVLACAEKKGGLKALRAVKTVKVKQVTTGAGSFETVTYYKKPLQMRVDYFAAGKPVRSIMTDGKKGFVLTPGKITPMDEPLLAEFNRSARSDSIGLLVSALEPGAKLTYLGEATVVGRKVEAVKINLPGLEATIYLAADTHDFMAIQRATSRGPVTMVFSDVRPVSGLRLAHATRILLGSSVFTVKVGELVINPKLGPDVFDPKKHPLNR